MPKNVLSPVMLCLIGIIVLLSRDANAQSQRPTLPPTWTPTFTPTASSTQTATPTATLTPTINPATYCEENFIADAPENGESFAYSRYMLIVLGSTGILGQIQVAFTHRLSGDVKAVAFEQPAYVGYELPVRLLPRAGLYDWSIQLVDTDGELICEKTGYFFIGREEWLPPTATVLSSPSPQVIVVTATPTPERLATLPSIREQGVTIIPPPTAITPDN